MSILVFTELSGGELKKSSLEAVYYGREVAKMLEASVVVLAIGSATSEALALAGNYGADKVLHANDPKLENPNILAYAEVLIAATRQLHAKVIITTKSSLADAVAARAAGALKAGLVGNVTALPTISDGFKVTRSIFTGKAFAQTEIKSDIKILAIKKNTLSPKTSSQLADVESFNVEIVAKSFETRVVETLKVDGTVPLPEADMVVSGGRGMKGPEHWQPLLEFAEALRAATACSKPVSDLDWRPHHEHVGQTGIKIAPNLYVACGISGAIQHLAGVNASKVIVVINNDPEAPFFKAADYGIVGDVFEVLPKLTAAVKGLD